MKVIEIDTSQELMDFVKFPMNLYLSDRKYIPPLISSELKTFQSKYNPLFIPSSTKLWMVKASNIVVGRIAAFIDNSDSVNNEKAVVKFGWFDVVNNNKIANVLLEKAESWARSINASVIHGPLGFTSFDKSGVLIEGFKEKPTIFSCYNFEYYASFIENYGYKKEYDWVEYRIKVPNTIPDKIVKGVDFVKNRFGIELIEIKNLKQIKNYKEEIRTVLNESYSALKGFSEISKSEFNKLFSRFIKLIIPEFTAFIRNSVGDFIGFGIAVPSYSDAFKKMNGRFFPLGVWHIIQAKKRVNTVDMLLIAIKPEYQKKGGHTIIFSKIAKALISKNVEILETTKELEKNGSIQNLWKDYEPFLHRRSRCYIKNLH